MPLPDRRDRFRQGPGRPPQRDRRPPPRRGPRDLNPAAFPRSITLVHLDEDVIVVDKAPGLVCMSTSQPSVESAIHRAGGTRPGFGPKIVGPIDRDASGLVVACNNERADKSVRPQFKPERGRRVYQAVIEGELDTPDAGLTLHSRLKVSARGVPEPFDSASNPTEGFDAICHVRVLAVGDGLTLVEVRAETDYPFQIRAQLAQRGHPIVGDKPYNATRNDLDRLALHALEVELIHPSNNARRRYRTKPLAAFWKLVDAKPPANAVVYGVEPAQPAEPAKPSATSWEHVAEWYDDLLEHRRSDHHDTVIVPGVIRMLDLKPGQSVLDLACGQGQLCEAIASHPIDGEGLLITGVDSSPALIEAAKGRSGGAAQYTVGEVERLGELDLGRFDRICCVLAFMNIERLDAALEQVTASLASDGRFIAVVLHPAFRIPRESHWGWLDRDGRPLQFRRVDQYLSPKSIEIVMNPGAVAEGAEPITTVTHHRSISELSQSLRKAGLVIESIEEWTSLRVSEPGPRAEAENTARREFPMFMALSAVHAPKNAG